MNGFYLKQNLDHDKLEKLLKEILKVEEPILLLKDDDFTIENERRYHYDRYGIICVYDVYQGDVSLLVRLIFEEQPDVRKIITNIEIAAQKYQLDFYLLDENDFDMGSYIRYSYTSKNKQKYQILEDDSEIKIYFTEEL